MDRIDNWQSVAQLAEREGRVVVVMVDQSDCPYCRRAESEFFASLLAGREYDDSVVFGKISIDPGETIIGAGGERISTRDFLSGLDASFTPTVLFLDADRNPLTKSMVGLSTPDFYGYYLERSIRDAIQALRG